MLIGELSKRSGLSRDTIRYYEKLQLLTVRTRCSGNQYKNYGAEDLERLRQVQQLKDIGFTLREVHQLLVANENRNPCKDLPDQLKQKLEKIDRQLVTLLKFKSALIDMKNTCGAECEMINGMPTCVPKADLALQTSKCC